MKARGYKIALALVSCVALYLAWCWWSLSQQKMWANLIHGQCRITQELFIDKSLGPEALAQRLDFLMEYYDGNSKRLAGSQLSGIVAQEYHQVLTNAIAAFRATSTNDLGNDPQAWIQKYRR